MQNLTFIVCQPTGMWEKPTEWNTARQIPLAISSLNSADLNTICQSLSTNYLAITLGTGNASTEEWEQCLNSFQTEPKQNVLLIFSSEQTEEFEAWQNLPLPVAELRQNWAKAVHGVIVRSSVIQEAKFAEVSDPIWDWIIRTATLPKAIQLRTRNGRIAGELQRPSLAPGSPSASRNWLKKHLTSASLQDLVPNATSRPDAIALKAGLLQIHDHLHESHELSQSIEGEGRNAAGDYWHAIMHRREPDYGNSKYWFRHVGNHPIFEPLRDAVDALLAKSDQPASQHTRQKLLTKSQWDPMAFVDFCQECAKGKDSDLTRIAEEIQWREMALLLEQTYRDATG